VGRPPARGGGRGDEPCVPHELLRGLEPCDVPDLRDDRERGDEGDTGDRREEFCLRVRMDEGLHPSVRIHDAFVEPVERPEVFREVRPERLRDLEPVEPHDALLPEEVRELVPDPVLVEDRVELVLHLRPLVDDLRAVPDDLLPRAHLLRGEVRLGEKVRPEEVAEDSGVNGVGLHTGGGDRLHAERVGEVDLAPEALEVIGVHVPLGDGFEGDGQARARERSNEHRDRIPIRLDRRLADLPTVPILHRERRGPLVEVHPDEQFLVGHMSEGE